MSLVQQQPAINSRAALWTILLHAVLIALFFLVKYRPPQVEPIDEMGMEVNLGTAADGYGTDQPMALGEPAPDNESAPAATAAAPANTDIPENIVESNEPEAPAVKTLPEKKKAPNTSNTTAANTGKKAEKATNESPTPQQARYVYGGSTGTGGNSATSDVRGSSEGNTRGNGDRGVPGGTPGADNYEGTPGNGRGISHNISGRSIVAFPPPEAEFKEGGRVTIRVTVNRQGEITNKSIVSSSNPQLRELALKKISSIRFNKSNTAPVEQFGNITFVFKTRS